MSTESQTLSREANRNWVKWLVVTLVLAAIAFLASPNGPLGGFWRPSADFPKPTDAQLPLFILLNLAEALTFGFGISFLIFAYPLMQTLLPASKGLTLAAHLSIAWLLFSWWPHDSLHVANGMNMNGLLAIEYGFHVTLMITGAILVYFFLALVRQRAVPSS
ncbi:MAG TPA: hypothetical protein VLT92_04810 [Burkholderiales bacterium]|nr:hypothetical protein [Burkholderiales bacterium]